MPVDLCEEVLIALRRITRAIDLHSRQLIQSHGLTGPQALILKKLLDTGQTPVGTLAQRVNLSQATVTDILNRLEKRGLVRRVRSETDRRRVLVEGTEEGKRLLQTSPPLLQKQFAERFKALQDWEQTLVLSTLQRVAGMMDARELPLSPSSQPALSRLRRKRLSKWKKAQPRGESAETDSHP
jgi:DNA-binding MarR family transcriptional regulator